MRALQHFEAFKKRHPWFDVVWALWSLFLTILGVMTLLKAVL